MGISLGAEILTTKKVIKNTLAFIITCCITPLVYGQWEGDWFALVKKSNGITQDIVLHIAKSKDKYDVTVDFPSEAKLGNKGSDIAISSGDIYFVLPKLQWALDAKYIASSKEIVGQIINNGRPQNATFSCTKVTAPAKEVTANRSNPEAGLAPDLESIRPIEGVNSLFIEELTWLEVRDALKEGKNTVIIATGGIEQSGPYIPTGKHNYILKVTTNAIAKKLGNALIAPIIPFVPEGDHEPVTSHMKYPGTISLTEETYEALLRDIVLSYKVEGFKNIILIGDSGGNQWGLYRVANELGKKWKIEGVNVLYVYDYYDNTRISKWLKDQGITETSEGIHDSYKVTAELLLLDPTYIRKDQRIAVNKFSINGVPLDPIEKTLEIAKKLVDYQSDFTVEAINKKLNTK